MSFDKAKAKRNAERFVAQGKIKAAIAEYRAVVDNDPRDIATLNMLGDLYAKNSEKGDAVRCYFQVADHYNLQGFAQKAIAIYNKISRIQPNSIEVSTKLAELHKSKGALSEARSHYTMLAEHYQKQGRRLEALAMYKQIALLDPNNTEVCLNLADSYLRENQQDDAVEAFAEAGTRFARLGSHEEAIGALMRGHEINRSDLRILEGLVKAHTALGRASKAVSLLEEILEKEPYNRDVLYLLIDCCLDSQNPADAEKAVIKLVEIEPANYPKFLDLIRTYLNVDDSASAARILTMSNEYLLAGGQSDECGKWINEILEREPDQLAGLHLLVRYNSWLNDTAGIRLALERLNEAASKAGSVDDERFALAQLTVIRPHETHYRDRLNEINEEYGFQETEVIEQLVEPAAKQSTADNNGKASLNGHNNKHELEAFHSDGQTPDKELEADILHSMADVSGGHEPVGGSPAEAVATLSDEQKIQKEIDSINFYIDNSYRDLATKALAEMVQEFGERAEFAQLRRRLNGEENDVAAEVSTNGKHSTISLDEMRSEFGLEGPDDAEDYETHYHTAVAYQEMGLTEQAIAEFQDAIACTSPTDGTRRFFYCANLLGHCFMQNGMANHAITWLNRALETPNISDEEHHGLWYELAMAHEANGDDDAAAKYFEQIYADNVDFRDVGERVKSLAVKG